MRNQLRIEEFITHLGTEGKRYLFIRLFPALICCNLSLQHLGVSWVAEATLYFTLDVKRYVPFHVRYQKPHSVSYHLPNATFYFTFLAKSHTLFHAQKIYLRKRQVL